VFPPEHRIRATGLAPVDRARQDKNSGFKHSPRGFVEHSRSVSPLVTPFVRGVAGRVPAAGVRFWRTVASSVPAWVSSWSGWRSLSEVSGEANRAPERQEKRDEAGHREHEDERERDVPRGRARGGVRAGEGDEHERGEEQADRRADLGVAFDSQRFHEDDLAAALCGPLRRDRSVGSRSVRSRSVRGHCLALLAALCHTPDYGHERQRRVDRIP